MERQSIAEAKAALRRDIRKKIRGMDSGSVRVSNAAIFKRVTELLPEYQSANVIFGFVGTVAEIDTRPIIERALASGKIVCVPLCIGPGIMETRAITGMNELEAGAYGILEPRADCPTIDAEKIELALVPCISCDRNCDRLGQGGGFYDRFMEHGRFPKIALCREALLLDKVPTEPWDLPVDAVVTEKEIYRKKRFVMGNNNE
jgi:5-formyltetrahydrofolate cyclo-ligase